MNSTSTSSADLQELVVSSIPSVLAVAGAAATYVFTWLRDGMKKKDDDSLARLQRQVKTFGRISTTSTTCASALKAYTFVWELKANIQLSALVRDVQPDFHEKIAALHGGYKVERGPVTEEEKDKINTMMSEMIRRLPECDLPEEYHKRVQKLSGMVAWFAYVESAVLPSNVIIEKELCENIDLFDLEMNAEHRIVKRVLEEKPFLANRLPKGWTFKDTIDNFTRYSSAYKRMEKAWSRGDYTATMVDENARYPVEFAIIMEAQFKDKSKKLADRTYKKFTADDAAEDAAEMVKGAAGNAAGKLGFESSSSNPKVQPEPDVESPPLPPTVSAPKETYKGA